MAYKIFDDTKSNKKKSDSFAEVQQYARKKYYGGGSNASPSSSKKNDDKKVYKNGFVPTSYLREYDRDDEDDKDVYKPSNATLYDRDVDLTDSNTVEEEKELRDATFKDITWNALKQGYYNSLLGEESYAAMMGEENERDKYEAILAGEDYQFETDNWFEEALHGAAQLLGQQARQLTNTRTLSAATGGMALGAGVGAAMGGGLGSLITAPAGAVAGMTSGFMAGSAMSNFEI